MKMNGIANDDAAFYIAWADFEASQHDQEKALAILKKAKERGVRIDQAAISLALHRLNGVREGEAGASNCRSLTPINAQRKLGQVPAGEGHSSVAVAHDDTVVVGRNQQPASNPGGDSADATVVMSKQPLGAARSSGANHARSKTTGPPKLFGLGKGKLGGPARRVTLSDDNDETDADSALLNASADTVQEPSARVDATSVDDTVRRPELQCVIETIAEGTEHSSSEGTLMSTASLRTASLPPVPGSTVIGHGRPSTPGPQATINECVQPVGATGQLDSGLHTPSGMATGLGSASAAAATNRAEILVNGVAYSVLEPVGKGGTSQVFRVVSPDNKTFALKQVRLDQDPSEAPALLQAVQNEIDLMVRFRANGLTKYVIELIDAEVKLDQQVVYMVMEFGEIDFAGMLKHQQEERMARSGADDDGLNENFVCMYWEQMLQAVNAMHEARVIHGDLKPMNFLSVRSTLKLIDFGIAKSMLSDNPEMTKIARECAHHAPHATTLPFCHVQQCPVA